MILQLLSTIFTMFAGVANAYMDLSAENLFSNNKYNKTKGGNNDENKWKQPYEKPTKNPWYYFGLVQPKYVESFPYSTTILVSFTDWWHKYQMVMISAFCLAIVLYSPVFIFLPFTKIIWLNKILIVVIDFLWFKTIYSFTFEQVYSRKKKKLTEK